jgi:hypothetical protein
MRKTEKCDDSMIATDVHIVTNRRLPKREYHDGDIVEFDFEPNSIDIYWHKVTIIGVVNGILYEEDGIRYKVQLRDNKRGIFGDAIVPEEKINKKIAESVMTIKCDFCEIRIHVNQKTPDDIKRRTEGWEKLCCLGKEKHVLNICCRCLEILENVDNKKCPYDQCETVSEQENSS